MHNGERSLAELDKAVTSCRACPRLVTWREGVAGTKAAFRGEAYWARPVPGFGPPDASIAVVGLAPSAHGANRTGRMFTGDPSGDFLFRVLHEVGLASQPTSERLGDGLELYRTRLVSPVRCAPPENKPTPAERDTCRPWLAEELTLLRPTLRAIVVLGAFGWQALLPVLAAAGWPVPRPRPAFAHGAVLELDDLRVFGCYHVSPRNVQTRLVTHAMVADVFRAATSVTASD
ncbi:uracil-DNA glycosylase [Amycolatopsis sp. NBC_01488]|uniref:uracil-DNA glycosylase n=1 Tax=Amycolatopsis sp. NBC_01488 TaxID=2903563 RepID=UPI002E2D7ADE|nr:uracil-DNA glycosylase [Amycolatopsis sp. NBC_01488]